MVTRYLLRLLILVWILFAGFIGITIGVGRLLQESAQWAHYRASDFNKQRYFSIYIHDNDRHITHRMTSLYGNNILPSWSNDGKQLAYIGAKDGAFHVYLADAIGQHPHQFDFETVTPTQPLWSPNNEWILLIGSQKETGETLVLNIITGKFTLLPPTSEAIWSPDSKNILYTVISKTNVVRRYTINIRCVMASASCPSSEVNELHLSDQTGLWFPVWSPDKSMIAFADQNKIIVAKLRCEDLIDTCIQDVKTINTEFGNSNPIWSPDGKQIAFVSGHYALNRYQIETGVIRSTVIQGIYPLLRDWSPDGQFIAYVSEQTGIGNMYLFNLNSEDSQPLFQNQITSSFPIWRPLPR